MASQKWPVLRGERTGEMGDSISGGRAPVLLVVLITSFCIASKMAEIESNR